MKKSSQFVKIDERLYHENSDSKTYEWVKNFYKLHVKLSELHPHFAINIEENDSPSKEHAYSENKSLVGLALFDNHWKVELIDGQEDEIDTFAGAEIVIHPASSYIAGSKNNPLSFQKFDKNGILFLMGKREWGNESKICFEFYLPDSIFILIWNQIFSKVSFVAVHMTIKADTFIPRFSSSSDTAIESAVDYAMFENFKKNIIY